MFGCRGLTTEQKTELALGLSRLSERQYGKVAKYRHLMDERGMDKRKVALSVLGVTTMGVAAFSDSFSSDDTVRKLSKVFAGICGVCIKYTFDAVWNWSGSNEDARNIKASVIEGERNEIMPLLAGLEQGTATDRREIFLMARAILEGERRVNRDEERKGAPTQAGPAPTQVAEMKERQSSQKNLPKSVSFLDPVQPNQSPENDGGEGMAEGEEGHPLGLAIYDWVQFEEDGSKEDSAVQRLYALSLENAQFTRDPLDEREPGQV